MTRYASKQAQALCALAEALAAYEARTLEAISGRVAGKGGFFQKLKAGSDCHTATAERVIANFDAIWPSELDWPCSLERSSGRPVIGKLPEIKAEFLADLTNAPIWVNGRRPRWWNDIQVRAFLTNSHRQMSILRAEKIAKQRFGDRAPGKSSIGDYWLRLDGYFADLKARRDA
jgi:hypothetical protein